MDIIENIEETNEREAEEKDINEAIKKIMNDKIDEKYLNTITNHTFFNMDRLVTCLANNIEGFTNAEEYGLTYYLLYVILGILFIRIIIK